MATTKADSKFRLTDEEKECVASHIVNAKLQQRARLYAGMSYARFNKIMHYGGGMTKRQYSRLIEFCKSTLASKDDT